MPLTHYGFVTAMQSAKSKSDFVRLALDSWDMVLEGLKGEVVVLENEREVECYFVHCCITLMRERRFSTPYAIFAEDSLDSEEKHPKKCDLVLGRAVAIEMKNRKSINTEEINEVKEDVLRLESYIREQNMFAGVFLMIDQTRRYKQQIAQFLESKTQSDSISWQETRVPGRKEALHTLVVVLLSRQTGP